MAVTATKGIINPRAAAAAVTEITKPVKTPPELEVQDAQGQTVAQAQPVPLSDAQLTAMVNSAAVAAAPAMEPPGVKEAVRGITAAVWIQNVQVNALWSLNQNRNSWAAFAGQGWQKFSDNSDSAIMAFTTLAAHARAVQGPTSYRLESDNKVHEIYVW